MTENTTPAGKKPTGIKKRPTTRIVKPKEIISRTGVVVTEIYCRRCMKKKPPVMFYQAVDNGFVDRNGYFSICSDCCNEIYNNFYAENKSVEKSILKTCRVLNIRYDEGAVQATNDQLLKYLEREKETAKTFGIYKSKLMKLQNTRIGERNTNEDFTFVEPITRIVDEETLNGVDDANYLKQMWGSNLEYDEYVWLENELAEWKKTHKCDTKAEETLLKELCFKGLEIRNARAEKRIPGSLVTEYQALMKTASVDPAKTAIAGSGKSQDTFSAFIKTIEQNEPAEYYEDKELFKDFDKIGWYFEKYVKRPLKNFVTQSRDFNVSEDDEEEEFGGEEFEDGDIPSSLQESGN
jgi:hypothetical protein